MAKKYTVTFDPDDGGWHVSVPRVPGARTQARSIEEGIRRIREALSLFVDDADSAELVEKVRISATERREIARALRLLKQADKKQREAADARRKLTRRLSAKHSVRDVARLLDLSPGRVQQLKH